MLEPNKPKSFGPQEQGRVQVDADFTKEVLTNNDYEAIQPTDNGFDEGIIYSLLNIYR